MKKIKKWNPGKLAHAKAGPGKLAFAIIEILVWIFIFSLWLVSIYAIMISTLKMNDYNSNYIIATSLAKEQIELVKNIRDTNYMNLKPFNLKNPEWMNFDDKDKFELNHYYKIENDFWSNLGYELTDITTDFVEWESNLDDMKDYRLCLSSQNLYTYDCFNPNSKKTNFYRFFYIEELKDKDWIYKNTFKLVSKVIWYKRWYHEFEISTVIADWKRL